MVRGNPYLLRIITRTDARNDPANWFTCMASAAAAGLAPRVHYTSIEDRIALTDFVDARPFPRDKALALLPITLGALHQLPPFPKPRLVGSYLASLDGFIARFGSAGILPPSETDELFELYSRARSVYPERDSDLVSSHNDLKPENVLFDGARPWLVDWEAAFLNDRYVDLSVAANFLVAGSTDEEAYLDAYFGEPAGPYRLARFFLMCQMIGVFYFVIFMWFASSGKPVSRCFDVPDFRDYNRRIWSGEVSLASSDAKLQYAQVHRAEALRNMRSGRFEDSLRLVAVPTP
jgi:Phosphotransferase enzyme family